MTERLQLSYDSLVRFVDANALVHRYATRPMTYAGEWYEGVLATEAETQDSFNGGVSAGDSVTLLINQASGTALRAVVATSGLTGVSIVVRLIGTATTTSGVTSYEHAKTLTIGTAELSAEGVTINAQDIEDTRLEALYPTLTWTTDKFRDIADSDAGLLIPYAVGTALKVRAVCISSDDTNLYYFHGVCDAPLLTLPIIAVNTGAKTFTVVGDYTSNISAGTVLFASTSSANAGRFKVVSAAFGGVNTVVTVSETIGSATVSGNLLVPPTVLAVYRDGRLVASSEYEVHMTWPVLTQMPDPDFDGSPVDWSGVNAGTGTGSLVAGVGRLTGDGASINYGRLVSSSITAECLRGAFTIATITLVTPGKVRLNNFSLGLDGTAVVSGQGTHTALVRQWSSDGRRRIDLSNFNTGYSGTVDVDNIALNTTDRLLMVRFIKEQVAPTGQRYVIECDVRGVDTRNAATEIARLLVAAGVTTDSTSFATVAAAATTAKMWADIGYGRTGRNGGNGEARMFRAWLYELLRLTRSTLYRTVSGSYAIAQDTSGSLPVSKDPATGGRFVVGKFRRGDRPSKVVLNYRPSGPDPSKLEGKKELVITGGNTGKTESVDMPIIRDHETADRFLTYMAKRFEFDATADVDWWGETNKLLIGGLLVLADATVYPGSRNWMIWKLQAVPGGAKLDLREYDASIYSYSTGVDPSDPVADYQPDYSQTLPLAPSALKITAGATMLSTGGTTLACVTVEAVPPTVNWIDVVFAVVHDTTGEVFQVSGTDIGSGKRGTNFPNLRPGEVYQLKAWAVNSFGVVGVTQGTFDATAIGGGGAVTTFTSPGYATLPSNVSSCTAIQGMGRLINVTWTLLSTANLARYVLEKKVGAGAFAELARLSLNNFTDPGVVIGTAYQYRVKGIDTHGNLSSSYATSGTVTPVGNVVGGISGNDIGSQTIATYNRSNVTTVTGTHNWTTATLMDQITVTHSLGRQPVAMVYSRGISTVQDAWVEPRNNGTTQITIMAHKQWNITTGNNSVAGDPHTHQLVVLTTGQLLWGVDYW
ncbi:MAG: hypothetical protein SGI99_05515 [Pseudomonadota bacterium]|nr:hypothetical protein [Pseudomonadota bacterium]